MTNALIDPTTDEQPMRHDDPVRRYVASDAALVITEGLALAVLVGVDGPAPWPVFRSLVVLGITAAALRARNRAGSRAHAWALLAFGLVGLIAGGAIGVGHLVKAGPSAEAVSGVVAFGAGLALVGLATTTLVRCARRWRKLLAAPLGIGTLGLVIFPMTLAVFVTNVPPLELGSARPTDAGMAYEDVSFRTEDGVRLVGWYVPSTNGAAVVLLAGAGSTRDEELDHAAVLARHGYGVLLLDVRGHGGSEGDAMLWGWFGDVDTRAAIDYLATRPDVTNGRIGAVGMSMGGEQVVGAAGADDRIRAAVAEGITARGTRDEGDVATGPGSWFIRTIDWTTAHAADLMTSAKPPTKLRHAIAATAPRPVLVIVGGTQPAEIDASVVFQNAAPDNLEVWIAPGAGHTEAYDVHPVEWERRVIEFLDRTLLAIT